MAVNPEEEIRRYKQLDAERGNWLTYFEDLARYGAPRRLGFVGDRAQGDRRVVPQIYNPIGIQCVQTLSAALHGMVMNPATDWLRIRLTEEALDEQPTAKQWTNGVSKRIAHGLASPQTSFHPQASQFLEDLACIGTAVMYCGKKKSGSLYVRTFTIGQCCIAENEYGDIDTVIRDGELTVRQIFQTWGKDSNKKVIEFYDKGDYDKKFKVINVCKPRTEYDPANKTPQHMPVSICYIMEQDQHVLEEGGVEEMPYVVARWWVATGEVYGRSPFMTALPAVKVANIAQKTILDAAEKAVRPSLTVPHEHLVGPVRSSPGGITYLRNKAEIGMLPTSPNLPFATEWLQALNNEIRTTMFVDQVQFTGDFKMTATEVIQRQTERMRLLGPVLGRLENEFLNPLITRVFGILARLGQIDKAPQEIQGADMRIEYQSPLARAQKSQIAQGFQQVMGILMPMVDAFAKGGAPQAAAELLSPINLSKVTPALFDWFGVDNDLLKGDDTKQQDQQQQNMRQMMQAIPAMAGAGADAAGAVSDIADAGHSVAKTAQVTKDVNNGQLPQAPGPPGPGAPDMASMIGAAARGVSQGANAPNGIGNIADLLKSFQGRAQ